MKFAERLDRAIFAVFPTWGRKRIAARAAFRIQEIFAERAKERASSWDSAKTDDRRGSAWLAGRLSPDSEQEEDLATLQERCGSEYRRNPYMASFVNGSVENVVGCGIRPQARVEEVPGVIDAARAEKLNVELEAAYKRWAETAFPREGSMDAGERLAERSVDMFGEAFIVQSDVSEADRVVPLALEIIDPARVSTPYEMAGSANCRMGIEVDGAGKPLRYWVQTTDPNDTVDVSFKWQPIDAARVQHVFEPLFPGQRRGFPPGAHILGRLKDLGDLQEAELVSTQIASCFSVFVETPGDAFGMAAGASNDATKSPRIEDVAGGRVQYLNTGEKITTANPARPHSQLTAFITHLLRSVAAGLSYPFELLVKDYTGCNYSVGRLSLIDGRLRFRSKQKLLIERMLRPIWRRFVTECVITGAVSIDAQEFIENRDAFCAHGWTAPGWPWIDPTKEVQSATESIRGNLSTLQSELAGKGDDWEETLAQRAREVKRCKELGLPTLTEPGPGAVVATDASNTEDSTADANEGGDEIADASEEEAELAAV